MENLLREKKRSMPGEASTIETECRACHRPMVSRRRHAQLGRPADKVRHIAKGLCRTCYDREYVSAPAQAARLERTEELLAEGGLTIEDIERIVSTTGRSGQGRPTKEGMTQLLGEGTDSHRAVPDQSARTPGRAVPRARLY